MNKLFGKIGGFAHDIENGIGSLFGGNKTPSAPADPRVPAQYIPGAGGMLRHAQETRQMIDSLKKGGDIKKTGMYRLHKGETVLNKKQAMARKMKK